MRKNYKLRLLMCSIVALVVSSSKLFGQVNVTATAATLSGTHATLNDAFAAINAGTYQGTIGIAITGNTTEPAASTALLPSNGTTIVYSSILIQPSGGNWIINSTAAPAANRGVIELNGADNVTIDGDDPGTPGLRNLTIQLATSTNVGVTGVRLSSNSTTGLDGANNCTVKNLTIVGSRAAGNSTVINYGINMSNYSTTSMTTGAYSSLNTLIENCAITRCLRAIYANGASYTYPNNGLIIRNNVIGSSTLADNVGGIGIYASNTTSNVANAALIEGNDIRCGDVIASSTGYAVTVSAIELATGSNFTKVLRNNIHDVIQPSTGIVGANGVLVSTATNTSAIQIANNFINNVIGSRASTTVLSTGTAYGIRYSGAATLQEIINNTIIVNAALNGATTNYVSYGVGIVSGATFNKFLNNIVINNNTGTGTFGIYCAANSAILAGTVNNNNYYVPSGNIGYYGGAVQTSFASWKASTGKDANGWNVLPNFISATDVHLQTSISLMESNGAPVATTGISNDYDNDARPGPAGSVNGGGTNPDIGADEYDGIPAPLPVLAFNSVTPAFTANCATSPARLISMTITTPSGTITGATLNYAYNGVAQASIAMTNTSGSIWEATIPTATPANATVTWSVDGTNSSAVTVSYTGTTYSDQPLLNHTTTINTLSTTVCTSANTVLSTVLSAGNPTYTNPSVSAPTTDEDFGSVLITQGATTILSNTTTGGSLTGTIGTATGVAGSYSNFTSFGPYTLNSGQSYNFSLTSITQGGNFGNSMAIFIDYNRNGVFTDAGEAAYLPAGTTVGPHTESGSFTIPMTALVGLTRMRVQVLETTILNASTTSNWGEYEEYSVFINNNGSYSWSDGSTVVGTTPSITVNPAATTTYTVTVTQAGCTSTGNVTINTLPLPAAPLATNSSQCGTQVPTASVASTAGASGTGQMYWYDAATNGNVLQNPPASAAYSTYYSNDFTSTTIGAGATLSGVASLTAVPGVLQLTPNATSQLGGITVDGGSYGFAYKVDFDVTTTPAGGADGFSYSFGDDVNASSTAPPAEMGSGTKFKVSFDSYGAMPNAAGIYILYNNNDLSFNASTSGVLGYVANTSWVGSANNHVTIETNDLGQVTITLNGTPIFTNVQLPATYLSANRTSWKHAIAGRTGGISMQQTIDNLVIQYKGFGPGNTTYNSNVAATSTFHVSELGTNGCYSATTPVTVTVITPAEINSSISNSVSCLGNPITLMSEAPAASPNYTFSWTSLPATGGGISGTVSGDTVTVTPTATGTYSYIVTGTNGTCTDQDTLVATINSFLPPAPTAATTVYNICSGTLSQLLTTDPLSASGTESVSSGTINIAIPDVTTVTTTLSMAGIPAGATITNMSVTVDIAHAWDSDLDISLTGPNGVNVDLSSDNGGSLDNYTNTVFSNTAVTPITSGTAPFTGTFLPEGNLANLFTIPNGTYTLVTTDDLGGFGGTINSWSISITYTMPPSNLVWYNAATGGNQIGSGNPYESVGSTVLPNANTGGSYSFYATAESGGCLSATRLPFTVNVTEVLATLSPVNNTCNGGNLGSFTLGTVSCGSGNFLYSLTGAAPFGPIPTNLTAGTYTVTIQDQVSMQTSAPISLTITEPAAPTALNATLVSYYDATLGWTENGTATSWTIIYGPTGFDPSTSGTVIPGATNTYLLDNVLDAATSYDFYVFTDCGTQPDTSGPFTFATDNGFLANDNECTPYIDIQTSGINLNLDDDTEAGVTLPFTFNYQGNPFTTLTVGNNGGIQLGTLTGQIGYGGNMTALADNFIFAWGDDMDGETGDVFWEVVGTAPNRIAVFQWQNLNNFTNGAGTVTFQIQLMETTNEIYIVYQDVTFGGSETADDYAGNADIGVSGPTTDINVSNNNMTYLQNNSCVHFYYELCPNITNFSSIIYADEAILDWNPGLYNETDWTIVLGAPGFDPTNAGEIIATYNETNSVVDMTNLIQNTEYDVYIYSECMADGITSDGFFFNFTTLPFCANPTAVTVGTDVDSLELTWNWSEYLLGPQTYDIAQFNIMYEMDGVYSNEVIADGINFADTVYDVNLIGSGVYEVYIQAECSTGDTSSWVGPITVVMPLSNDTVCGAEMLEMDYVYTLNNAGATVSLDEVNIAPPATGSQETDGWATSTLNNTVWYSFVAPASGSVRINNTAINYNGQLAVYDVFDCADFNANFLLVGANDNEIGGASLAPNFTICGLTPGDVYYVMHDGTGTTGNYSISISEIVLEAGSAGALTQICYGETVDLNTTISGNDAGGVWSSSIPTVNAGIIGSVFNSDGLSYQTFNFQYRMVDGCAYDSIVSQVQVFAPSSAGTDGTITICKNEPVNLYTGLGGIVDMTGQWFDPSDNPTSSDITGSAFPGSFNYDYIAGNGVCPDDTAGVVIIVLSTCDELSTDEGIFTNVQLYPNPTSGIINIDADKVYEVVVTDANGKLIKDSISTTVGTSSIDLGKVQIGVYFVTLKNEGISKVYRVIVQ